MSRPNGNAAAGATSVERYLTFSLGNEEYAIPLLKVKEVIAVPDITPIPFAPVHFLGVINLRGQIVSVIDLRTKLGMTSTLVGEETALIIVNLETILIGTIVDTANKVLGITAAETSLPPDLFAARSGACITGIVRKDSKLILLLDIAKTLDLSDLTTIETHAKAKVA